MGNFNEVLKADTAAHVDADGSAEVEEVTVYLGPDSDTPQWTGNVQVFRDVPVRQDDLTVAGLMVFVSRSALDVDAKDVQEVEVARNRGEDATRRAVTRVEYEDGGGFMLVVS